MEGHPGIKSADVLGRVYTIHPNQQECFFLRMLLHEVTVPESFEELRTVDGTVCPTFREACNRRGLLEDDANWDATLEEASVSQAPTQLRTLFAIMLQNCELADPLTLWKKHRENLAEDIIYQHCRQDPDVQVDFHDFIFNKALITIEDTVLALGGWTLNVYGLPVLDRCRDTTPQEYLRETS